MSGYGSPSLRKMEGQFNRRERPRRRFTMGRILGDPFALATISISILAWLIAFAASVAAQVQISDRNWLYPKFGWWAVAYHLVCIVGIILMVATDSVYHYHVAAVGFLAYGVVLASNFIDWEVYSPYGSEEAAAAGFILLAIVFCIWMFYFGSQPQASHRNFIDSFALHRSTEGPSAHTSRHLPAERFGQPSPSYLNSPADRHRNNLTGLETSSPTPQYPTVMPTGSRGSPSQVQQKFERAQSPQNYQPSQPSNLGSIRHEEEEPAATEYPYKARAIYSYEANPDDANEISFQKHEILEVSDVSGRWWQAKKSNGETGIAPSNYLILL